MTLSCREVVMGGYYYTIPVTETACMALVPLKWAQCKHSRLGVMRTHIFAPLMSVRCLQMLPSMLVTAGDDGCALVFDFP